MTILPAKTRHYQDSDHSEGTTGYLMHRHVLVTSSKFTTGLHNYQGKNKWVQSSTICHSHSAPAWNDNCMSTEI